MKFRSLLTLLGLFLLGIAPLAAQQPDTLRHSVPPPSVGSVQAGGQLGSAVAVDGNYTVVGAPSDDLGVTDTGAVKVFNTTTGALLYVLPNPTPEVDDQYGAAVAISGTRVVVGAWRDNAGTADAGCAYVFDLASANPTVPVVTLNNPTPAISDYFGVSVAISGPRVVVGVWRDDTGATDAGAACVYNLDGATPSVPVYTINNPSPAVSDQFGFVVAIDGTRVVIGCHGDDTGGTDAGSAYVYDLAGATPTAPILTLNNPSPAASDLFGYSVAISGTRVVVGAVWDDTGATDSGVAYAYNIAGTTPAVPVATFNNPTPSNNDWFGAMVAISGTRVAIGTYLDDTGATDAGTVYIYDLTSATPGTPVQTLANPGAASGDYFGVGLAIAGTKLVVGASNDDTAGTDAGSVYVYDLAGGTPTVPTLTISNPGPSLGDLFATSIAVSGTRVVVGSYLDDTGAVNAGRVFVYDLSGATPTVPAFTIDNPTPLADDQFGISVAISGTRVVVGANLDDVGATNAGSAYVYDLAGATPTAPVVTLNNPAPAANDNFGIAVAISGTRVVVGANLDDGGTTDAGSVYVYDVSSGTPATPIYSLVNPAPAVNDQFGSSVAISGTRMVVGAPLDDAGATDAGSAYVYNFAGATPTVATVLGNPAAAAGDNFGSAVAISGTRVVVGASSDDAGAVNSGSAYVYDVAGATPTTPVVTLTNPGPAVDDRFGVSVSISGTRVVVGAYQDDTGATNSGSIYIYDLTSGTPTTPVVTKSNPTPGVGDFFGYAVSIDGTTVAVGAPYDDTVILDKGYAYIFAPDSTAPTGGTMTFTPVSPVDPSATLTVTFANWTDASLPLTYTVLVDDVVVSSAGSSASRLVIAPAAAGAHTLKGRIADAAGNVAEVTQGFTVLTAQESWRRQYFGVTTNDGNAADTADPDGDGQNNLFEFIAGLVPNSAASRFAVRVDAVVGQPGQKAIVFGPVVAGRTYVVKSKASLADATWTALSSSTTSDNGTERTVTDLAAGSGARFYTVEITKP